MGFRINVNRIKILVFVIAFSFQGCHDKVKQDENLKLKISIIYYDCSN